MVYIAGNSNYKVDDILDLVHEKEKKPASNPFAGKPFVCLFFVGGVPFPMKRITIEGFE